MRQENRRFMEIALEALEKTKISSDKFLSHQEILQTHESRLNNHDRRIGSLEAKA
jgi:hypothetical protein